MNTNELKGSLGVDLVGEKNDAIVFNTELALLVPVNAAVWLSAWDYVGVMTVGGTEGSLKGYYQDEMGSINPDISHLTHGVFHEGDASPEFLTIGRLPFDPLPNDAVLEVTGTIITGFTLSGNVLVKEMGDPFSLVGQTDVIKLQLIF